ncbi:putative lipoprotein NlpE involved in copper resistance [Caldalkalibacillus uzonensis]|uniref:Lipoprotein NlpE involved in copper resistance n=1 Tax=Caldalkalibacillus uzonensis TaxID=353224 RepID=A0ABU0CSM0_9BACI|nr:hypothetical protein [Caldalkalibacillus uzonensis]MDQ0339411.1 putative lipoprotein NlpE involved in copper resistance [Caldalkalibacillus uzonensis]
MFKKLLLSLALVSILLVGCAEGADDPGTEQPADVQEPAGEGESSN